MSRFMVFFVIALAIEAFEAKVVDVKDSKTEQSGLYGSVISAEPAAILVDGGLGGLSHSVGSGIALNSAAQAGAAQLSAIQNAQAVKATEIANSAAAAIQGARVTEAAARAGQASALQNAQALEGARIANIQRAQAAAVENARANEAARRAATAASVELARAAEAERLANAARAQAIAIANTRAVEASRIAQSARAQAAAVATSAAQAQAVADAVAINAQNGALLLGAGELGGARAVGIGAGGLGGLGGLGGWGLGYAKGYGHQHHY